VVLRELLIVLLAVMQEKVLKLLNLFQESDSVYLSCSEKRGMRELGFLPLSSRYQLSQVFFEEATELDHDDKKLLACGSILDDETFKSFVVFDNWVALLL
jgi:hypothetical protein